MLHNDYLIKQALSMLGIKNPDEYQVSQMGSIIMYQQLAAGSVKLKKILTHREFFCLYLAARGKSSDESAKIIGLKKTTIDAYRQNILKKLEVSNITEAVFKAVQLRLL